MFTHISSLIGGGDGDSHKHQKQKLRGYEYDDDDEILEKYPYATTMQHIHKLKQDGGGDSQLKYGYPNTTIGENEYSESVALSRVKSVARGTRSRITQIKNKLEQNSSRGVFSDTPWKSRKRFVLSPIINNDSENENSSSPTYDIDIDTHTPEFPISTNSKKLIIRGQIPSPTQSSDPLVQHLTHIENITPDQNTPEHTSEELSEHTSEELSEKTPEHTSDQDNLEQITPKELTDIEENKKAIETVRRIENNIEDEMKSLPQTQNIPEIFENAIDNIVEVADSYRIGLISNKIEKFEDSVAQFLQNLTKNRENIQSGGHDNREIILRNPLQNLNSKFAKYQTGGGNSNTENMNNNMYLGGFVTALLDNDNNMQIGGGDDDVDELLSGGFMTEMKKRIMNMYG